MLRRLVRGLRHAPDRLLHSLRRRRALAQLRTRRFPSSILVVCHGNICRSPYAAGVLRRLLSDGKPVPIASAGFVGPDRPAPPAALASAAGHGVSLSDHRSRLLVPREARAADLIIVMDAEQRQAVCRAYGRSRRDVLVLGDFDPSPIDARAIHDPLGQPAAVFEASYARIDRCLGQLVRALSGEPASR